VDAISTLGSKAATAAPTVPPLATETSSVLHSSDVGQAEDASTQPTPANGSGAEAAVDTRSQMNEAMSSTADHSHAVLQDPPLREIAGLQIRKISNFKMPKHAQTPLSERNHFQAVPRYAAGVRSVRIEQTKPSEDKDDLAMSKKEQVAMQVQLQQLTEQVKKLQDALEERTRKTTLLPVSRRIRTTNPKAAQVLKRALSQYRTSIQHLVKAAVDLERKMPKSAASIVTLIERRLVAVGRDALIEHDTRILSSLKRYKGGQVIGFAQGESANIDDAMKQYRHFASALADIANALECMASPAVGHIAVMARDRLDAITQEAELENDFRMRDLMTLTNAAPSQKRLPLAANTLPPTPPINAIQDDVAELGTSASTRLKKPGLKNRDSSLQKNKIDQKFTGRTNKERSSMQPQNNTPIRRVWDATTESPGVKHEHDSEELSSHRSGQSGAQSTASEKPTSQQYGHVDKELLKPSRSVPRLSDEASGRSLLDELFPEASTSPPRYAEKQDPYPKLGLPKSIALIHRELVDQPKTLKEQVVESFQNRGEKITVLQLEYCSTELTEMDFRRLIPQGKHIESWNRDGEFYKVIPGRDPLSLERLPFYYLLFKTPESAYAYQNNAARLHKLTALHKPSSIFSAIPAPRGFLEDGEDINKVTSAYLLKPTEHAISLRTIMQPYHPALRALIERGGYNPIVPQVDEKGNRIHKVLMHIEGYEPSVSDLFKIFKRDAYNKGLMLSLRNESLSSIHRLRDIINLKTRMELVSTSNPRAYSHFESSNAPSSRSTKDMRLEFDDPNIAYLMKSGADSDDNDVAKEVNQIVMNRVYNRWIIDFDDEDQARRFAISWHRRVLPNVVYGERTWKDYEEVRMCNCELLW
jgi:hypothetical protein